MNCPHSCEHASKYFAIVSLTNSHCQRNIARWNLALVETRFFRPETEFSLDLPLSVVVPFFSLTKRSP